MQLKHSISSNWIKLNETSLILAVGLMKAQNMHSTVYSRLKQYLYFDAVI